MANIAWWVLIVIGVLLITSELLVSIFVLIWFGLGFIVSGIISYFFPSLSWGTQVLVAAFIGAVTLFWGRKYCIKTDNDTDPNLATFDGGVGELVIRQEQERTSISVQCRGTYWTVANPQILQKHPELTNGAGVMVEKIIDNKAVISPL